MTFIPFTLPENSRILIVGAGGGFDFLCGLPLGLELQNQGHEIHFASYSFTNLQNVHSAIWHSTNLLEITADSSINDDEYFPEKYLAQWLRLHYSIKKPVWCLSRQGVQPTLESYEYLIARYRINVVFCVDGGVDGLFRGDEYDLATPSMDSISVIATSLCSASAKVYVCTAFGTEGAESKVSHAQALQRIANLTQQNAMLGVSAILQQSNIGKDFSEAVRFIFGKMKPIHRSTVISTIVAAMEGRFGRVSVNEKSIERQPWISPLTTLFWFFDAGAVARMKLFYEQAKASITVEEVARAIEAIRQETFIQPYETIPI